MKYLILLLALVSIQVQADTKLGLILFSPHFNDQPLIVNETPNGIYIEHNGYGIGNLTNSYGDNSSFIYKKYDLIDSVTVNLGVISGYEKDTRNINGLLPLVSISYKYKIFTASIISNAAVF